MIINDLDKIVVVDKADWDEIKKVLTWVHDNPGCHPENIKKELEKLYQKHVVE